MAYHSTIKQYPTYLHVTGVGVNSKGNVRDFLVEAYRASVERECRSLLLEMNFSGPSRVSGALTPSLRNEARRGRCSNASPT